MVNYALRTGSVAVVFGISAMVAALGSPKAAEYLWLVVIIPLALLRLPTLQNGVAEHKTPRRTGLGTDPGTNS